MSRVISGETGETSGLVDATGRRHEPHPRPRIISLVPSLTELLFDLDLAEQVVGRTTFCIHPSPAIESVPRVGGTKTPRLDRIAALDATHVLLNVDENRREDAEALADMGLIPVVTHPLGPTDNPPLYRLLGGIFCRSGQAERLAGRFARAHAALRTACAQGVRRRVLYLIWRNPWMTVSAETYISRTLADAGMDTVPIDTPERYPEVCADGVDWETVDAVLLSSEPYPFKASHRDEIRQLAAREDLPVNLIDGEMTSWYGSRAIAGCEYLAGFDPVA